MSEESTALTTREIGDEMKDGTIYAGISPDSGKPLYTTPRDAPGAYTHEQATEYAKNLDAHGHHDFRVPNPDELDVLYENRDKGKLKGTFNETSSDPAGYYFASTPYETVHSWGSQRFSDGYYFPLSCRINNSSLRCVR
jgi:hypothetical protein